MSIRGSITIECDRPDCHAEIVLFELDIEAEPRRRGGVDLTAYAPDWRMDGDLFICPQCAEPDERDEAYERAAARARANDFSATNGRDWT